MEIVLVSSVSFTGSGEGRASGTAAYIKELSEELVKRNIPVSLVTGSVSGLANEEKENIRVYPASGSGVKSNFGFVFKLIFKMRRIKLDKNAIIHAQRPEFLLPFIWFKGKNPKICTLHGSPYKSVEMKHTSLYTGFYRRIEQYCLKRCTKIIAVDKATRNEYKERYPSITEKITVIPTGLNLKKFQIKTKKPLREKYEIPKNAKVILYVGRLEREKRIDLLIKAFQRLSENYINTKQPLLLLIVGDGRLRTELAEQAKELKLKNVRFIGALPHDSIPEIMNSADIFVLLSAFEGSPTVVKEALACGLPVVATNVGNIPELVEPGISGDLIELNAELAEISGKIQNVMKLMEDNTITKESCKAKAAPFSWNTISDELVGIYNDV
jgi:glycosyltransferase involved in cell wall biosynthesis